MDSDDSLILRCSTDPAAFRELVRRYKAKLYGFLIHMAGHDAADDLFQELWLRVFKAAAHYEPRGQASSWLFKIARGVALNHLTRRGIWARTQSEDSAQDFPDPSPTPHTVLEHSDLKVRMRAALAALPREQREVFLLRESGGMSFKEIAAELDIPLGTALSRMNYALIKLKVSLRE
ncbi:MAG: sigma-70 family RNA polymerase sigma factor [Elusimicrobiales bacterium]|nr:sigma-70 family RNA polymerase sigma factor [Elusimicrobiales bacterium]